MSSPRSEFGETMDKKQFYDSLTYCLSL
jgi:hypothetical protein